MSELEEVPDGVDLPRGEADLAAAARQLRAVPAGPRAVEVANRVLQRALAAPRRSVMIRAAAPHEHLRVSSIAVTAIVRERLDEALVDAAVRHVVLDVDRDGLLSSVTVDLVVRYGTVVADVGEQARALARQALDETLGRPEPGGEVPIAIGHAHVSDVTVGDPHLVDPADERA
ncbi:hypothetical protein [Aeromicrobium sp. Leaf350]|uniref:hypothetical protein n=1 Tax=Aeromicrobium sp. Leaf350 TaxID=2876565 RepID=UPI001E4ABAC3|nr:hypothetical protein [Aeromicrobium sp. Leaf350]